MPLPKPFTTDQLAEERLYLREMISKVQALPEPISDKTKFSIKQDLDMLIFILQKSNQAEIINSAASNYDQFMVLKNNLLKQLHEMQATFPKTDEEPHQSIKDFEECLKKFEKHKLPSYANTIRGLIKIDLKDIEKILPHLKWIPGAGGTAEFHGPESLAEFIGDICNFMKQTNYQNVNFTIYLPPPSEDEQKKMEKNPNERIYEYARFAYEAAAKAGYEPSKVNLKIDNKTIDFKDEAFKSELSNWQRLAQSANEKRLADTRKIAAQTEPSLAKPLQTDDETTPTTPRL